MNTHLNAIIPLPTMAAALIEAGRLDLLACQPEGTYIYVYDECNPDSEKLMEFASRNGLYVVQIDDDGKQYGVPYAPAVHRNVYKVWRKSPPPYDSYCGFVCIASSMDRAKRLNPAGANDHGDPLFDFTNEWDSWVNDPEDLNGLYIGPAYDGAPEQIVLSSFRNG